MGTNILNPFEIFAEEGGIPTEGLVAYWPFNGNANDESDNSFDGTVNGATLTTDRDSNANSAFDFNGTSDNIDFGDMNFAALFGAEFSLSQWVKFDTLASDRVMFQATANNDILSRFYFAKQNGGNFRLLIDGYFSDVAIVVNVDTINWFHFVLNLKRNVSNILEIELFKNASSIYTNTVAHSGNIFSPSNHLVMGSLAVGGARFHDGKMDDIRMYDTIRTSDQVTDLFNE